jgi:aminoglycoside 3-N-acetyltransferase
MPTMTDGDSVFDPASTPTSAMGISAETWLQREGPVGNGGARLCASRDVITVATEHLGADPLMFLCGREEGCEECDAARASVR